MLSELFSFKRLTDTDRKDELVQRLLLGLGTCNMLFFYLLPSPNDVGRINLPSAILMAFLLLMVGRWHRLVITHIALGYSLFFLCFLCAQTGGITSPSMVWFTLLPVAALMVAGARTSQFYLVMVILAGLGLVAAGQIGWIDPTLNQSKESIPWALALVGSVCITQQLIVTIYGRTNSRQMAELEKRNEDFERAQASLMQAQSHKDEFIASMGHELRTPMNAILGLNDVLQAELQDRHEDLQLAELIRTSTEQLLRLVNDILLLSQLEANRVMLRIEPVNLRQRLDALRDRWLPQAQAKGLVLAVECDEGLPQWVNIDPNRLDQLLEQLLDNAIKFTQQGYVSVQARIDKAHLRIDVQDTGPGIARDKLLKIFDRFEQADVHTNRAFGGTGIGLAICKRLAELHKGQLQVQSELGKGAHFWMSLPIEQAQAPDHAHSSLELAIAEPRVLVVDDNPVILKLTDKSIRQQWPGARIELAQSAELALQWLAQHDADVVIADRIMPGMDGLELAQRIRAHERPQVAEVAILGLTAYEETSESQRCIEAGMDDVVTKPIAPDQLADKIVQVMRKRKALRTGSAA